MRALAFTCASILALAAAPAMAQSSNQSGQQQGKTGTSGQQPQAQAMTQQKLRSDLEKAGFSNVTVVDAAYLVAADTSDGNQVMMFINPPARSASAGGSGGSGGSGSGSSGQGSTTNQ